jgi:Bacterial extracellular solute-binding proteins, family 5 Middle
VFPRGTGRRVALVIVVAGLLIVGATLLAYRSPRPAAGPANPATSTLSLALPGPFNGCSVLSPSATATTSAILDLIRPSAFLTGPTNVLFGEGGAIVSAELISLHPEKVVYTVAPKMRWSNHVAFSVNDLVSWWRSARTIDSVASDGYRAISSMTVNKTRTSVTATFGTQFGDWNLLFRDVEQSGATRSCAISQLATQPSLGPYTVESATTSRVVLTSNPAWSINYNRFHKIIITSTLQIPADNPKYYVQYSPVASNALIANLVEHPRYLGQMGDSSDIVEVAFSPHNVLTTSRALRTALSWSIDRKNVIAQLFGSFTFRPSVPTSALFSQGQLGYPAPLTPIVATAQNSALVDPSQDCRSCALAILRGAHYVHSARGWTRPGGHPLHITLAQGPSALDHASAKLVAHQWTSMGIGVTIVSEPADDLAATMAATGAADASIFDRPTSTTPWLSARSWGEAPYLDSYPSGLRTATTNTLFALAQATFNPATAALTWLQIDHSILTNFWVRPLYTVPSMTEWSGSVANVVTSLSMSGLVDQATNWGIAIPSTTTTQRTPPTSVG